MFGKRGKVAQTTLEYAIILTLVVGAVAAMQLYVKRGLNSRIRDAVDHTGKAEDIGGADFQFAGDQYEPYYLSSSASTNQQASNTENMATGGSVTRGSSSTTTATQSQTMGWNE